MKKQINFDKTLFYPITKSSSPGPLTGNTMVSLRSRINTWSLFQPIIILLVRELSFFHT